MYGIQKDNTDELSCRAEMETDIENRLVDMWQGLGKEAEVNGEGSRETYTLPYVKQIVSGHMLYSRS